MALYNSQASPARSVADLIALYGFAVTGVGYGMCSVPGCRCGARERHPWSYTTGLSLAGLPELVLMGLDPRSAQFAINWVGNQRRAGHPVPVEVPFVLDGVKAKVLPVPDEWLLTDFSRLAAWFKHFSPAGESVAVPEVQQVVWPDAAGRFPDDPRCDPAVMREQPILRDAPRHYPRPFVDSRQRHGKRRRTKR